MGRRSSSTPASASICCWGKMLRIDVDRPDKEHYSIPPTNPMARAVQDRMMALFGMTEEGFSKIRMGARPEIWAYGLRNPYMFHFDRRSGDLFIAEVGQNHWEEINWPAGVEQGRPELRLALQPCARIAIRPDRSRPRSAPSSARCRSPNTRTRSPTLARRS